MTTIEWTDETWNPVTGCTKVSQGCKHCYAERLWPKVETARVRRNAPIDEAAFADGLKIRPFTKVLTHPERLDAPLHWKKPRRVFVNSMSDLFHEDVPDDFILKVFDVMRQCENGYSAQLGRAVSQHTFQILTKRAERMRDFCTRLRFAQNDDRGLYLAKELPHNGFNPMTSLRHVWLGVSVEDQATADERIPLLLQTPAAVRFLSCEPLLGPVDLNINWPDRSKVNALTRNGNGIDWVIGGGESGPGARPAHPDWFRSLRDQCAAAGVAFFFKQWGEWGASCNHGLADPGVPGKQTTVMPPYVMYRVGKKAAGRLLDGRLHDAYPEAQR